MGHIVFQLLQSIFYIIPLLVLRGIITTGRNRMSSSVTSSKLPLKGGLEGETATQHFVGGGGS